MEKISGYAPESMHYTNQKSQSLIQAQRMENYSDEILEALDRYAEEIESTIMPYNRKSCEETMMIKGTRKSSQETTNRKTHMENLEGIATEIARHLGLKVGVARIIARNHDIGHTFSGHSGEWWLSNVKEEYGLGCYCHNALGPAELIYRDGIYDEVLNTIQEFNPDITTKELARIRSSLWLIFDGINAHNGEKTETEFIPKRDKTEQDFEEELEHCFTTKNFDKTITPATMEGCLIRLCDKISYIPYDMVDGIREGIIDKIDGEYIPILNNLGISQEEIDRCNLTQNYNPIIRKLQILFTRDVIENSSASAIRMSYDMSYLMHELRNINNRRIVSYTVLKEDSEIYPRAVKQLMGTFAGILSQRDYLDRLPDIGNDKSFAEDIIGDYKDTPYEGFARYMAGVTKEEYDFTKGYVEKASRAAVENDFTKNYPSLKEKMRLEFGARYLSTLNDIEFFDLVKNAGLITEEQEKSLRRTYKEIGKEGLEMESQAHKEFTANSKEQMAETQRINKKAHEGYEDDGNR